MSRLLRYLGFRWIAATWAGLLVVLVVRSFLSAPPEQLAEWPTPAVRAASNGVAGIYQIGFGLWVGLALAPIRWLVPWRYDRLFGFVRIAATVIAGAGGGWLLIKSVGAFAATPAEWRPLALAAVGDVTLIPLLAGVGPWLWIEASERLRTCRFVWRWWYAGLGAHSAWIAPYDLRKITHSIPRRLTS